MASDYSFDITCDYDHQEMVNAVDQLHREITNRFDFKGVLAEIDYNEKDNEITIRTDSDYKLEAIVDILESKILKRGISLNTLDKSAAIEAAANGSVKKKIILRSGLTSEDAKKISKLIRDEYPKAKPTIQGDEIRVVSKSKDELQQIIDFLKDADLVLPLQFGNYR